MKNLELRSSTHDGKLKRQALAAMVYREKQFIHQHWETKGKLLPRESETLHQLSFEFEMHTPLALSRNPNRTFKSLKKKKRKTIKIYQINGAYNVYFNQKGPFCPISILYLQISNSSLRFLPGYLHEDQQRAFSELKNFRTSMKDHLYLVDMSESQESDLGCDGLSTCRLGQVTVLSYLVKCFCEGVLEM